MKKPDKNNRKGFTINTEILELLTQNSFDVISILADDGTIKFESSAIERITGYKAPERLGRSVFEFVHPEDVERVFKEFSTRDKKTKKVEFRFSHKNGNWVWLEAIGQNFLDNPTIQGILVNSRDITDHIKVEEALKKEKIFSKKIVENADAIIVGLDRDHIIKIFNRGAEHITGYKKEEVIGKDWFKMFFPKEILDEMNKVWENSWGVQTHAYINPILSKTGEQKIVSWQNTGMYDGDDASEHLLLSFGEDITDRKKAENKLRLQSAAITQSPSIIMITDTDGNIQYVNPSFEASSGYTIDDAIGKTPRILKSGRHTKEFYKNIWDTIQNGNHWKGEIHNRKKDGSFFWESVNIFPIFDEHGNITNYIKASEDISETKKIETALKESELQYKALFNENFSVMLLIDPETGNIMDANKAACIFYGYSHKHITQMKISEINTLSEKEVYNEMQCAKDKKRNVFYFKHKLQSGIIKDVEVYSGKIVIRSKEYLYSIIHDVSERRQTEVALKKSEAKFKALANNTADGLHVFSPQNGVEYVSPSFLQINGYSEQEELSRKENDFGKYIHPEDRNKTLQAIYNAIANKETHLEYTYRWLHKKGHYIWRKDKITFEYNEQGVYQKAYKICSDISKEVETEKAIQEANNAKDRFISIIAHDLRSPFNSILGFADLLVKNLDKYDKGKIKKFVENIHLSAHNTYSLLLNLLEWSRSQRNKIPFEPKEIHFHHLVQDTYMLSKNMAEEKNIKINIEIPPEITFEADSEMIKTIIRNLLSNAIKYTRQNGEIMISAKQIHNNIVIHVKDNGVGMSEKIRSSLFKIDKTKSQKGTNGEHGTGFGLLLSKEFVDKHRGNIEVESEFNKGSSFVVTLPMRQTQQKADNVI